MKAALVTLGLSQDEAEQAVREDRVALALVSRMSRSGGPYTLEEVAERAEVPVWALRERLRALGVSEQARFGEAEVEEARLLRRMLEVIEPASLVRVLRTDAQALSRIALAHLELAHEHFVKPVREAGGDDVAVALSLAEAHHSLRDTVEELLRYSYHHILEQLLSSEIVAAATRIADEQMELAVGFADVVGYTSLSAHIDPQGLEDVLEAFESRCFAVAGTAEGIQLVKFLGDAAMFASTEPTALAEALLSVVELPDEDSPLAVAPIRAAFAVGPVTMRGGDYFGTTVNIAARLTDRTRPGRLLADETARDHLADEFLLHRLPPMPLRGVGLRRPIAVRPKG